MTPQPIDAKKILSLLSARHARDVAVAECSLEPYGGLRADLWVTRPSWSKPLTTIYEIKVSRQDFLRDDKWVNYLPYCNVFYFATPPGLIDKRELPEGVGLVEAAKTGNMLRTVSKAVWRADDHEAMARVTKSVLMNRFWLRGGLQMADHRPKTRAERIAEWRQTVVADGPLVGKLVRGRIMDELNQAIRERDTALSRVMDVEVFRQEIERRGLNINRAWNVDLELDRVTRSRLKPALEAASRDIASALSILQGLGEITDNAASDGEANA